MQPQSIMVFNGKGGVAKTSLSANLAGVVALGEWRVLAVDLDVQGNLSRDLGVMDRSDEGQGLFRAAVSSAPLQPLVDVRPGLDLVPGGRHLREAVAAIGEDPLWLDRSLAPIADNYDLIVIDTPPGIWQLHEAGTATAAYVLIPTLVDDASIDGLAQVIDQVVDARQRTNPHIEILAVVLTLVPAGAARIIADPRERLGAILDGSGIPVLEPTLRHAVRASIGTRNRGRLAHEYEQAAATTPRTPWWKRRQGESVVGEEEFSGAASGLAEDYQRITEAVMDLYMGRIEEATNG